MKTIIILRPTEPLALYDYDDFISKIPKEEFEWRRFNMSVLKDGTKILAMSEAARQRGADRGLMNVEYR